MMMAWANLHRIVRGIATGALLWRFEECNPNDDGKAALLLPELPPAPA